MNDREPFIYIKQMYMKGFFDLEENCKEKIISEDYWDFIIPLYRDEELKEVNPENACIQEMDFGYKSVSVDRRILLPLSFREYWYSTIPKCYTLLDMQPLDAAGIITLQNYPTLQFAYEVSGNSVFNTTLSSTPSGEENAPFISLYTTPL